MTAHSDKSKNLISAFSTMTPGGQPQTVRLVPVLRINDDGLFLSLKIGTSRLYSVKEFAHIFKMLKSGEPIKRKLFAFAFKVRAAEIPAGPLPIIIQSVILFL